MKTFYSINNDWFLKDCEVRADEYYNLEMSNVRWSKSSSNCVISSGIYNIFYFHVLGMWMVNINQIYTHTWGNAK